MFIRLGTPSGFRITSTGAPVLEERHVLLGDDLRDDALVAVAAGELVALGDLALLRDVDADELVDARATGRRPLSRENVLTSITLPPSPCGTLSEVSRTSRAFSLKIARISFSSAVSSVSPFGVTLPTSRSPEPTSAPMRTIAALVEVLERLLRAVRDVARDLLVAELRRAGVDLVLVDVDRREHVVLDEPLGDDDRVLEVVALERHERDEQVRAERELALRRSSEPSASTSLALHAVARARRPASGGSACPGSSA